MSRIVDKVFRGSWTGSAGNIGNMSCSEIFVDPVIDFYSEFSVAAYIQIKPQPDTHWAAYPGAGVGKLSIGTGGFNQQLSGGAGISRGVAHFRVDDGASELTLNPTAQGGVKAGTMLGWQFHVGTVKSGVSRCYVNGKKQGQRNYSFAAGHRAPGSDLTFAGYGGVGGGSRLHRNNAVNYAVYNRELTPEEVYDWYFGNIKPTRGLVFDISADNWVSGPVINRVNPSTGMNSPVSTLSNTEVPS